MKKILLLTSTLAFVLMIGLQSCGGGAAGNSPGETVKKSLSLLADKKYEKVVEMYSKSDGTAFTKEENEKMLGLMTMASAELEKKNGLKSVEILEEKIAEDGKKATVKWKVTYGNNETDDENGELINVNGDWKMVIGN